MALDFEPLYLILILKDNRVYEMKLFRLDRKKISERCRTVQMLASRNEPDIELFEVDHPSFLSLLMKDTLIS